MNTAAKTKLRAIHVSGLNCGQLMSSCVETDAARTYSKGDNAALDEMRQRIERQQGARMNIFITIDLNMGRNMIVPPSHHPGMSLCRGHQNQPWVTFDTVPSAAVWMFSL